MKADGTDGHRDVEGPDMVPVSILALAMRSRMEWERIRRTLVMRLGSGV
jgi:hypothetical protein